MRLRFVSGFFFFCLSLAAQSVPDLVLFDEDDPLGRDYYDASIGESKQGSALNLLATSRDKMPVITNSAANGRVSGRLRWNSAQRGDWQLHLFAPGFPLLNLSRHDRIVLQANGPREIPGENLPMVELRDVRNRTISTPLIISSGTSLDSSPATWQPIELKLTEFRGATNLDFTRVKHITFRQSTADQTARELWIDTVRFSSVNPLVATQPPAAPTNLKGRSGDRSTTLHWEPMTFASEHVQRYRVFREAPASGEWIELSHSPVLTPSIADVQVENGKNYRYQVRAENEAGLGAPSQPLALVPHEFRSDDDFLEYLQATAFDYFWYEANPQNGMVRDRTQPWSAASIAAIGFGLSAVPIGIDHNWITRKEGAERVYRTFKTLWSTAQGQAESGTSGYKGWFYHFLKMEDATRFGTSELSSIDTALLLAGVLDSAEYFSDSNPRESEIRSLAERIFARVDWRWMLNKGDTLTMGWNPEHGFLRARWNGYNEASILYILGIGAEGPNALTADSWQHWTKTYSWRTNLGFSFIHFPPLFGHQYSACWIDFKHIADDYTSARGITYFENSRRATLAQRAYCMANPGGFPGYGADTWGLTACDGPGSNGTHSYIARGAPPAENDDGTLAPTAAGGSLPFAPAECLTTLRSMYDRYREKIWCGYGFRDAFNLKEDWWGEDVIGIDQGPILLMAENMRSGRVWERMKRNPVLRKGLESAGFRPIQKEGATQRQN